MHFIIRPFAPTDNSDITDIYNYYIQNSVITFETDPVSQETMLQRIESITADFPCLVYVEDDRIVGYCYVHAWKEKRAYRYTVENTIYVSPRHQGKGIGKELLAALINECQAAGFHSLIACITEGNEASNRLHEKFGFKQVSRFTKVGYKFGRWLDVLDFQLLLEPVESDNFSLND